MLKSIEILNKFDTVVRSETDLTDDDRYFITHWEIDFTKALLHDFGYKHSRKIANLILSVIDSSDT